MDKKFESVDGIEWRGLSENLKLLYDYLENEDGKKIIRKVQDLSQRTSQLHEKINYINVQKQLEQLEKNFMDYLYYWNEKYYRNGFVDVIELLEI